jgi:hypothetical protein
MGILGWLFKGRKKPEEVKQETKRQEAKAKPVEEKISTNSYSKINSDLLNMRETLAELTQGLATRDPNELEKQVEQQRKEYRRILGETIHLDKDQRKATSGLFHEMDTKLESLKKNIAIMKAQKKREAA